MYRRKLHILAIAFLISCSGSVAASTPVVSPAPSDLLKQADLSIAFYGAPVRTKTYLVGDETHIRWLITDGIYGGDGDSPGRIMMIFEVYIPDAIRKLDKILQISLEDVVVDAQGDGVKITGRHVVSLCDTCDSWDAAEEQDVFFIPLEIDLPGPVIKPTLSKQAASTLLKNLSARIKHNNVEMLCCAGRHYADFSAAQLQEARTLLVGVSRP